ncbi:MAG TPA: universal stress protein [Dongiaceae bacterium]|jgi:nucleotide-binding universal stress UspA family protein|nr:universal stress protein [Dongiaceae bacterium]
MRILLPVDGSSSSLAAVQFMIGKAPKAADGIEIHLLNAQPPLPYAATSFVDSATVKDFHLEEGNKALAQAKALLDKAGVRYETHVAIGDAAEAIASYAEQKHCGEIVMGTRGLGRVAGMILGSVAYKVLQLSKVPVTLVK